MRTENDSMTVLQILPALKGGGVETGTIDMARALVERGHRAIVISSGGPMVEQLKAAGVLHYTLPVHLKSPIAVFRVSRRVAEVIESHQVDVIHARSRVPAFVGFLAWRRIVGRGPGLRDRRTVPSFITTAHGIYAPHWFSRVMGWGRVVIANSEAVARHMIDTFGVPPQRIRVIPRGVDLNRFAWKEPRLSDPAGKWHIAAVGRITPLKGHRELLAAYQIVAKTYPSSRLSIVGGVEPKHQKYFNALRELVVKLGLEEQVTFTGPEPDVAKFLQGVDLCVLPSTGREAFGRILIEAGAAGVPVVATRIGGISEVVEDKKTGLLVPADPLEPMTLASAITMLLNDRAQAAALARAARKRVESHFPMSRMVEETLEVYREAHRRLRLLVVKMTALGDVVLCGPSLRALRERFPDAHITVLTGRAAMDLLHRCPHFNDLLVYDRKKDRLGMEGFRLAARLRAAQVDAVVDLQNNRISHWVGFFSLAPLRYGYSGRRFSFLLTHRVFDPDSPLPPVQHQFRLLELLGVRGADERLELWPGPADHGKAEGLLRGAWIADGQGLVAVHPSGHPRWSSKRWGTDRFVELIDRLGRESGVRVVLTGSADDRALAEKIYQAAHVKPIVAAGKTSMNELAALLARCRVFVSGDTAPLHVAAAMNLPIVALFGSTDPARHMPPAARARVFRKKLPCSPCYSPVCRRRGKGHMECMNRIEVEEVLGAVKAFLKGGVG